MAGGGDSDGELDLAPRWTVVLGGSTPAALLSFVTLPPGLALASSLLAVLMLAGAEVDARTYLLPNAVTFGGIAAGILLASAMTPADPAAAAAAALARGLATAAVLLGLRWLYFRRRAREGLGLGDVKLGGAIGAVLPLQAIPQCFALASFSALIFIVIYRFSGKPIEATSKLPFGAFLCPSLWLIFYAWSLPR